MDANNSSLALELATAISFLLFAGGFWVVSSLGGWAIAPVDRFAAAQRARTRFCLSDLLVLLLQVQLAIGASLWLAAGDFRWLISACALTSLGSAAMWWVSLRRLTTCGVACRRRRTAFLGLVAPLTCTAIALGLWFNGRAVFEIVSSGDFASAPWLAGNLAALVAFLLCRRLTLWVLHDAGVVDLAATRAAMPAAN
jgi:hypothetical protein